jgi:hypothetical protein
LLQSRGCCKYQTEDKNVIYIELKTGNVQWTVSDLPIRMAALFERYTQI